MSAEEKGKKVGKPAASGEKTDDKKGKPPVRTIRTPFYKISNDIRCPVSGNY